MESSQNFPLVGQVEVDESYVGDQDDKALGRNDWKKKIMVVGTEKLEKGVSRWYGRVVETASKVNLGTFMLDHVDKDANVKTDFWSGYKGMESHFLNLVRKKSGKKGENFKQMHRVIMMSFCSCGDYIDDSIDSTYQDPSEISNPVKIFKNLSTNDLLIVNALNSLNQKTIDNKISSNSLRVLDNLGDVGLFEYENGRSAVSFTFNDRTENVFVQVLDSGKESDFIIANFNEHRATDKSKPSISFKSLNSGSLFLYNSREEAGQISGRASLRGWGRCMDSSIDKLFDDWEDDPVGTFGCWVLSPLYVVGAGLGCAVKEFKN